MTIAISMGDPAGIGPQIAIKAWQYFRANFHSLAIDFAIIGDPSVFIMAAKSLGLDDIVLAIDDIQSAREVFTNQLPILKSIALSAPVIIGEPNVANANSIISAIEDSVKLVCEKKADAIVTLPIAKSVLYEAGFKFAGHTEYIAQLCASNIQKPPPIPVMMLAIDGLKVALVTIHEPLKAVPKILNIDLVCEIARITNNALKNDFGIREPKIAILGLNPHAGEEGAMGSEEIEIINPAANILRSEGFNCSNAIPADSAFNPDNLAKYDCFIAMYHDQGLIPIKTLDYFGGVNITLGLPIIRTSPDHGTGFGIAKQNNANPQSLINAIIAAADMAKKRALANAKA